jgi:hypothetical protein
METWYQCHTQHRFNFIFPSGSFSLANAAHSPQALPFAEANGKHIRHLPFAIRFSEMALPILTLKRMANKRRCHKVQVLCVILISGSGLTLLSPPKLWPFDLDLLDF